MNSVSYMLKNRPLTYEDKVAIKEMGRCTPWLDLKKTSAGKARQFNRYFNTANTYKKFTWMCGCPEKKKLFCFVCLLSNSDVHSSGWIDEGYSDLQHLRDAARRHENSAPHISHMLDFNLLDKVDIARQFDSAYIESIREHNEAVDKNRNILRRLIMCIKFCGTFELALRGHEDHELAQNPELFPGLINFTSELSELDSALATHLKETTAFKGNEKNIQNEVLGAMLQVCKDEIYSQISKANFLAIEAGETTDSLNQQQLVIILRYVFQGKTCERFWGFFKPERFSSETIANVLKHELNQLKIPNEKLIAQCYDGVSIMVGKEAASVPSLIRQIYPHAHCIPCYAHQLNIVLEKAAYCNKKLKLFFADIQAFASFFAQSTKRTAVLDQTARRRFPHDSKVTWDFKAKTINTIHGAKELIRECLETILDTEDGSSKTISEANSLLRALSCIDFNYFLEVTHSISFHVETFFQEVQSLGADSTEYVSNCLKKFEWEINHIIQNKFEISEGTHQIEEAAGVKRNQVAAKKYCEVIMTQIREMFDFTGHLSLANLFSSANMHPTHIHKFPEEMLIKSVEVYEKLIDKEKFKMELKVIYNRQDMRYSEVSSLLRFICSYKLEEGLSDTYKILDIISTTPMINCPSEQCFSTLNRIRAFSKNSTDQDRLNALTMLSVENELVQSIPDFDSKVIDKFVGGKIQRVEFLYK